MPNKIILASKSKVRKDILDKNNIQCVVEPSNVDEDPVKESLLKEQRIGISSLNFDSDFDTEKSKIINQAIIKKNREKGIFTEKFTGIRIIGDRLFRSSIELPQDIKEGTYEVSIYFFEDQQLVDNDVSNVFVNKTQSGKFIYNQANENPLLYGVFSVLIAWAAGLIVAGVSRVR